MLIHSASQLVTPLGGVRHGKEMSDLQIIPDGAVLVRDGRIVEAGSTDDLMRAYPDEEKLDASGKAVIPGLVDPHTHLVWAGDRAVEFEMRLQGKTYMEIMAAGGGIASTVRATRQAGVQELVRQALPRARSMLAKRRASAHRARWLRALSPHRKAALAGRSAALRSRAERGERSASA